MKAKHIGKQILFGVALLCPGVLATSAAAQVHVEVGLALPPPIVFVTPPQVVVLPGYDIYVAPDIAEEVYFVDGWWWRPWHRHWYRSRSYNDGWHSYSSVPSFYRYVRHDWRRDYRNHRWGGRAWNYRRMPHHQVEQNWHSWKSTNYWQSQDNWGVPGMKAHAHARDQRPADRASHDRSHQRQSPPSQHHAARPEASRSQRHSAPKPAQQPHGGPHPQARAQHPQHHERRHHPTQAQDHGHGDNDQGQPSAHHEEAHHGK